MKKFHLLITLLLVLAACAPAAEIPTATATLTSTDQPSATPTTDPTPTPKHTATPEPSPTLDVPKYYAGLAPTIEIFDEHLVEESQIKDIIDDLRSKPSLLDATAQPVSPTLGGTETDKIISISCNVDGVNCAPAASFSIFANGYVRQIIIMEIKNADNTRGYLRGYVHGGPERTGTKGYERLLANPTGYQDFAILLKIINIEQRNLPYTKTLLEQDGFIALAEMFLETKIIPQKLENMIVSISF